MALKSRYFNSSGPNIPAEHYTLMREHLIAQGAELVHQARYFTIWAPRQTGKSTYFMLLKTELERAGYLVAWTSMEKMADAEYSGLLRNLQSKLQEAGLDAPKFNTLDDFAYFLENRRTEKVVLIIDEVEGLNPEYFGRFLHTLRYLYHTRLEHCLKSVILVGVSNIVGVVESNASPFNIADNLEIPFFTIAETYELLGQHEQETGQLFDAGVKERIAGLTACQPGLVNGFAAALVKHCRGKAKIVAADYVAVEDWYLNEAIDKNVANIINKAKKHRAFVETLLFSETKIRFQIDREPIKELYTIGLITRDESGNVAFKVPLYCKRLHAAFYPYTNGEQNRVSSEINVNDYFLPDGRLNFEKWVAQYKTWVQRRSFRYFREKNERGEYLSIKEAALVYSFETYMAAFLDEAGGKSYLEPHTGLGRSDLIINVQNREYITEFKVYSGASNFTKGKKQLAYYCRKYNLNEGEYVVFVPGNLQLPPAVAEKTETVDGIAVRAWLVPYDEEKDF
jgi:AAA domain